MHESYYWLNEIKKVLAIAQTGFAYSTNPYDIERYNQLVDISQKLFSHYSQANFEKIQSLFENERGYVTPKVDVRAAIFDGRKILMVKEKMDGLWSIPGGWADVGLSPYEIAVKETFEESGLIVIPEKVLAIMDKKWHPHPPSPFYAYKIFVLCKVTGGEMKAGEETSDVNYFEIDKHPQLSVERITEDQLQILWKQYQNPEMAIYCE